MITKLPWYFQIMLLEAPLLLFCEKELPWVIFGKNKMSPTNLWVLLVMCSKKNLKIGT